MLGLIKKDLFMVKGNLKIIIVIFVVFSFMTINDNNGNFSFIPAFISVVIMMSTFSYDEFNKTNAFIITLPNGKRNAVKAKYLATLLIALISVILTFILSVIVGYIKNNLNIDEAISTSIGCCCGVALIQAILYPIIYKFGIEKSRIGIFVGVFGITGILSILMKSGMKISIPQNIINILSDYWFVIFPIFIICLLFISYKISEHLYLKKEF